MSLDLEAVVRHGAELQRASSFDELLGFAARAVHDLTGYAHTWIARAVDVERQVVAMHVAHLRDGALIVDPTIEVPFAGDPVVQEVLSGARTVVLVDARTDPRANPAVVELFQSRTAVNVPLLSGARVLGALGSGTCGDAEGVRPPTEEQLALLTLYALQLGAAVERLTALDHGANEARERGELERRMQGLQRLESVALLTSGVAHDFNNLLAVVRSAFDELREVALEPEQREAVDDGREASERCQKLARDLLSVARTRSERRRVLLDERVRGVIQLVKSSLPVGIVITYAPGSTLEVDADPSKLDQLLTNLLLNARDALGAKGRISVSIDEHTVEAAELSPADAATPGRFARLTIQDDGPGIPAELRTRIFEPFFTTKQSGTGMGLAIVSQVVHQHGGLLRCDPPPGGGARFRICLPLLQAE